MELPAFAASARADSLNWMLFMLQATSSVQIFEMLAACMSAYNELAYSEVAGPSFDQGFRGGALVEIALLRRRLRRCENEASTKGLLATQENGLSMQEVLKRSRRSIDKSLIIKKPTKRDLPEEARDVHSTRMEYSHREHAGDTFNYHRVLARAGAPMSTSDSLRKKNALQFAIERAKDATGMLEHACGMLVPEPIVLQESDREESICGKFRMDLAIAPKISSPKHNNDIKPSPLGGTREGGYPPVADVTSESLRRSARKLSSSDERLHVPDVGVLSVPNPWEFMKKDADKWFQRLTNHTHSLLSFDPTTPPKRRRVRIAIVDSGIAFDRRGQPTSEASKWFSSKRRNSVAKYKDFTGESPGTSDSSESLHGTNCASLAMQTAPEADIYVANVQALNGDIVPKTVARALKWAIASKVDIISLSIGWDVMWSEVAHQINIARTHKILVFAAASNCGDLGPQTGVFPANQAGVFRVYSCKGNGARSHFNSRSSPSKIKFTFPGEATTLYRLGKPVGGLGRFTGISFAAPIAAGTAALVLELVRLALEEPDIVEDRLKTYEVMSEIFLGMSSEPDGEDYYHVMPWRVLGEPKGAKTRFNLDETHLHSTLICLMKYVDMAEHGDLVLK